MAGPRTLTFYPFAYALLDDEQQNYCWFCLKEPSESSTLRRCAKCKRAVFCDRQCQERGWPDHKPECHAVALHPAEPLDIEVRLLGRIVARYKKIRCGKDGAPDFYVNRTSRRGIMEIWSHEEDMRADAKAWARFEEIHDRMTASYPVSSLLDKETTFQLHCRNFINRHAISDRDYLKEIGKGLYLDLCAYDHSCRPNAIYTCDGVVATLRPLTDDVRLDDRATTFYSYIDLLNAKHQRRRMLKESWYFGCECERCADDAEHALTAVRCGGGCDAAVALFGERASVCAECARPLTDERRAAAVEAMRRVDLFVNSNKLAGMQRREALAFVRGFMDECRPVLPEMNIYFTRLIQLALGFLQADDADLQLQLHLDAVACLRLCYPQRHPALAYHLVNIASLGAASRPHLAVECLGEAIDSFASSLGADHQMTRNAQQLLSTVNESQPLEDK